MKSASSLLIVQTGHPPLNIRQLAGEQPQWFCDASGVALADIRVVCPFEGEPLPAPEEFAAAVISGAWEMVTDKAPWSEQTAGWIRNVMDAQRPLMGICYGHQLMAYALGGEVDYHPDGKESGQKPVTLTDCGKNDPFFADFPPYFDAFLSHEQSVLTLPAGAQVLGFSDHDQHQILRYSPQAFSVQFHPEFTAAIMSAETGQAATGIFSTTPDSRVILQQFVRQNLNNNEFYL